MHADIRAYNAAQPSPAKAICRALATQLDAELKGGASKLWHRGPVWFIGDNPIVGYWARKTYVQLLFWSGQSFDEPGLSAAGKFKAAEQRLTTLADLHPPTMRRWLKLAARIQWDYAQIVKRRGVLEKLGTW